MNTTKDTLPGAIDVNAARTQRQMMTIYLYAIPAGCLIGWLLGSWLDRHFHTGWIAIAGILVGAVAGFVLIFTVATWYMKNSR
jgi:F0F1-type ATP synthase assembly protein I